MLRHFDWDVLSQKVKLLPFYFVVQNSDEIVECLKVNLSVDPCVESIYILDVCFLSQKLIDVRSVSFSVKSVSDWLLVRFLVQRLVDELKISFLLDHRVQVREVFLEGKPRHPFVEVLAHFIEPFVHLSELHIDLMDIGFSEHHSGELLNWHFVAQDIL